MASKKSLSLVACLLMTAAPAVKASEVALEDENLDGAEEAVSVEEGFVAKAKKNVKEIAIGVAGVAALVSTGMLVKARSTKAKVVTPQEEDLKAQVITPRDGPSQDAAPQVKALEAKVVTPRDDASQDEALKAQVAALVAHIAPQVKALEAALDSLFSDEDKVPAAIAFNSAEAALATAIATVLDPKVLAEVNKILAEILAAAAAAKPKVNKILAAKAKAPPASGS